MQSTDESKKRPRIEVYSIMLKGHLIPTLKTIEILQNTNPNFDVSFVTGPLIKSRYQGLYPNINMVEVQDEFNEVVQKQMVGEKFGKVFAYILNYMHKYLQQKTDKPDLIISNFCVPQAMNYASKNGIKLIVNHPNAYSSSCGMYNFLSLDRSIHVEGYTILCPQPDNSFLKMFEILFEAFRYKGVVVFNSFIGLDDPTILPSNHILVGLLSNSITKHQQMETSLTDWMNGWRKKGNSKFLYISFGSMIQLSEEFTKKVVRVIQKLQYPTIWSLRSPNAHLIQSELIYHREWLPQQLILQQEDVRGYLTHGGWGSICEAIANSTPMVCIPIFSDQAGNAKLMAKRHIAISIPNFYINACPQFLDIPIEEQILATAIRSIMEDASYFQSMKRMSRLSKTHDTARNISTIVERMLQFGCEYLISAAYEDATIKDNSVPLKDILVQKYWPLLQKQ